MIKYNIKIFLKAFVVYNFIKSTSWELLLFPENMCVMQSAWTFSLVILLKNSFAKLLVELWKNFGKEIYPLQKCSRDKNFSFHTHAHVRTRSNHLFRDWWRSEKKVRGKEPKIDAAPGVRAVGSATRFISTASPLLSAPVFQTVAHRRRSTFSFDSRIAHVRRKRLCASTRLCFTTANRGVFSTRFMARKMCRRTTVESISKKITFSSLCVKRAERRRERSEQLRRRSYFQSVACKSVCALVAFCVRPIRLSFERKFENARYKRFDGFGNTRTAERRIETQKYDNDTTL